MSLHDRTYITLPLNADLLEGETFVLGIDPPRKGQEHWSAQFNRVELIAVRRFNLQQAAVQCLHLLFHTSQSTSHAIFFSRLTEYLIERSYVVKLRPVPARHFFMNNGYDHGGYLTLANAEKILDQLKVPFDPQNAPPGLDANGDLVEEEPEETGEVSPAFAVAPSAEPVEVVTDLSPLERLVAAVESFSEEVPGEPMPEAEPQVETINDITKDYPLPYIAEGESFSLGYRDYLGLSVIIGTFRVVSGDLNLRELHDRHVIRSSMTMSVAQYVAEFIEYLTSRYSIEVTPSTSDTIPFVVPHIAQEVVGHRGRILTTVWATFNGDLPHIVVRTRAANAVPREETHDPS